VVFESYSFDVDRALITWTVDGKEVLSGIGERRVSVVLGDEGSVTRVVVSVRPNEGGTFSDRINITPSSVALVWEATDTYTPTLYKGKALPSEGGNIRVIAIPSFYTGSNYYNPKTVNYQWTINGEPVRALSGVGKQTLETKLNYFENTNSISVVATTFDGLLSAEESIDIVPTPISPRFYVYDQLLGPLYEKSFVSRVEINTPTSFIFEPFYISGSSLTSQNLTYTWLLNGLPVMPNVDGTITVTPKENASGIGNLSVTVENTKKYLQKAESLLQIVFNTTR
jgi:hypothetical protein